MILHCGGVNGCFEYNLHLYLYVVFDVVGLSWASQWDKPHDVFHMVVNLYQVLNPSSARCWDSEDALLTSQEGDKVASH
jgi:hypothetical protein